MTNLVETPQWESGIYQLETLDPVQGGPNGIDNLQAKQLGNRTQFLKALIEAAQNSLAGHNSATDPHPQYLTTAEGNSMIASAVSALVNSSPATLDTLNELATALGNDPNFATSMATALGNKQPLDATLTALAALATAANKLIYATGADTFGTTDITAFARTLLAANTADAAMATLLVTNGFAISKTTNGYIKLPEWLGGLIIQWGQATMPYVGSLYSQITITLPIACPSSQAFASAVAVDVNSKTTSGRDSIAIDCVNQNNTGFIAYIDPQTASLSASFAFKWFSIGF